MTSSASPVSVGPNGPIIQIASRPQLIPVSMSASGGGVPQRTTLAQRHLVGLSPHGQPQILRLGQPGQPLLRQGTVNSPQISLAPNALSAMGGTPRTILVKTADGSNQIMHMVQIQNAPGVGPTFIRAPQQGGLAPGTPTTIRTAQGTQYVVSPSVSIQQSIQQQQQQQQPKMVVAQGAPPTIGGAPQTMTVAASSLSGVPTNTPLSIQTTTANSQAASAAPSQMSPSTAKKKCKNFLSTLIRLANDQPDQVATNVRMLIQGLVDDTIQPEDFTNNLQKELNSSPQPCLVPFLKKSLPYLRYSLLKEELTIDGVRAPHSNTVTITSGGMAIGNGTAQAAAQAQQAAQVAAAQMGGPHGLTQLQHLSRGPQQMVRLITPQQGQTLAGMGGHPLGHGPQQIITSLAHGGNLAGTPIMLTSAMGGGGPAQLLTTVTTAQQHQLHQQQQQQQHQHLATSLGVGPPTQQPGGILSAATTLPQTRMPVPTMMQVGHPVHQMGAPLNALPINQCQLHPGAPTIPPPARATTPSKPKAPSKSKAAKEKAEAKKAAAAANAAALAAASAASSGGAGVPGVFPGPAGAGPAVPGEKGGAAKASFRDDDDINDVAAMGGVNLQEESQRILGTGAEIIGQQIRSCKDEPFLHGTPLHSRISGIVRKHELTDCSADVIALVSHAVQERLKTLVEKLGCIAEHRQEQFKNNPNYVVYQDVKAQVQFLQELDRIEKKRHEEQEREVLIKAAKSRSKMDDPDHIAIKARAKEMQRQEMEEIRQREANETALQAIGFPKKRQKTGPATSGGGTNSSGGPSSVGGGGSGGGTDGPFGTGGGGGGSLNNLSGGSNSNGLGLGSSSSSGLTNHSGGGGGGLGGSGGGNGAGSGSSTKPAIKRIKRVTMKDVYFMMEHEHDIVRSHSLYRTYAR